MKLDKYIKLTDEDVALLEHIQDNDTDLSDWTNDELIESLRRLADKMVVVRPVSHSFNFMKRSEDAGAVSVSFRSREES